jgi:hypothetical protein
MRSQHHHSLKIIANVIEEKEQRSEEGRRWKEKRTVNPVVLIREKEINGIH